MLEFTFMRSCSCDMSALTEPTSVDLLLICILLYSLFPLGLGKSGVRIYRYYAICMLPMLGSVLLIIKFGWVCFLSANIFLASNDCPSH